MSAQRLTLPGLPNLHSHAFQRAMAGLAERQTNPNDSFWTWRELMYRFAARMTPDSMRAIAAQAYVEMLEAGFTTVCEFHYVHHLPGGKPYPESAAMSQAIIQAARDTGIRLTLLPVLYMHGGFDGRDLSDRQKRFGHTVDDFLSLLVGLRKLENDSLRVGMALHSLRAVPEAAMREVLEVEALDRPRPIHIHVAEQMAEVDECLKVRGARPVRWLLDHADVDARWTLVHATHLLDDEIEGIADAGATVAICTTTEANLGDGLFPLKAFLQAGGRFGIGSDSNVSISPAEELRWLEYGQRLATRQRNIAVDYGETSVGALLYSHALKEGVVACGQPKAAEDKLILDDAAPALAGATDKDLHDRYVFAGNRPLVKETWVAGKRVVADGRHGQRDRIASEYRETMKAMLAG
jgi:formimidoylglutamate deiminase